MSDPMTAKKRWSLLGAYWLAQGMVLWFGYVFVAATFGDAGIDLLPIDEYGSALFEEDVLQFVGIWVAVLTGLQCLFLLPIHSLPPKRGHGKSLYVSMAAGAALISLVVVGFVAAVTELVMLYDRYEPQGWSWPAVAIGLGTSWAFFTVLLVRYARRSALHDDDLLAQVARGLFKGTIIETAALIPIDVMVRRKTDCYCWSGSFVALGLGGAVGLVVAGPAVFLPLFIRHERRRRAGRCPWCDYDLGGVGADAPCPECGETRERY